MFDTTRTEERNAKTKQSVIRAHRGSSCHSTNDTEHVGRGWTAEGRDVAASPSNSNLSSTTAARATTPGWGNPKTRAT